MFSILLVTAAIAAPAPTESKAPADWPAALKEREFKFDADASGIENCAAAARKAGATVEVPLPDPNGLERSLEVKILIKDGKPVEILAHRASAYVVTGDRLFFADYSAWSSGCKLIAYDLTTGKKLWSAPVEGIGPISHTKYRNRVALTLEKHPAADAWGVVVTGWESAGRYVEVRDPATGKMLANRKYDAK